MSHSDLLNSMNMLDVEEGSKYKYLFDLADKDRNGQISFSEFALFEMMATKPDAEFEMAFRLFDAHNNGVVTREDVLQVMSRNKYQFDSNCNLMLRFFGPNGKRKLRLPEFSQFFLNLTVSVLCHMIITSLRSPRTSHVSDHITTIVIHLNIIVNSPRSSFHHDRHLIMIRKRSPVSCSSRSIRRERASSPETNSQSYSVNLAPSVCPPESKRDSTV